MIVIAAKHNPSENRHIGGAAVLRLVRDVCRVSPPSRQMDLAVRNFAKQFSAANVLAMGGVRSSEHL